MLVNKYVVQRLYVQYIQKNTTHFLHIKNKPSGSLGKKLRLIYEKQRTAQAILDIFGGKS